MACGIPLVCSPWEDTEHLFPRGAYFLARNGEEMTAAISLVLRDRDLADDLVRNGLKAIQDDHTCVHRVRELITIVESLKASQKSEGRREVVHPEGLATL
jgi:spore maturation protein CgeB